MNWYKKANKSPTPHEMKAIQSLVKKIMRGERNWTPQELQLQLNFPELIEKMLMEKYNEPA